MEQEKSCDYSSKLPFKKKKKKNKRALTDKARKVTH